MKNLYLLIFLGIQKHVMEPVLPLQNVLRKEEQLVGTVLQGKSTK